MRRAEREGASKPGYMHIGKAQADSTYVVDVRTHTVNREAGRRLWKGKLWKERAHTSTRMAGKHQAARMMRK